VLSRDTRGRDPSPSARKRLSGKRLLPRVPAHGTRGRGHLPRVLEHGTRRRLFSIVLANGSVQCCRQMQIFFCECPSSPSVALREAIFPRVPPFPEFHGFCDTRERLSSLSSFLPRVQHSGKIGFPECPIFGTRERVWHSGNFGCHFGSPVA
jgi:hypothetical protein